jgi:hypothetical protein
MENETEKETEKETEMRTAVCSLCETGRPSDTRSSRLDLGLVLVLVLVLGLLSCTGPIPGRLPSRIEEARLALERIERRYSDTRELYFQAGVTSARGAERSERGVPLRDLVRAYAGGRSHLLEELDALDTISLGTDDRRAARTMRATLQRTPPDSSALTSPSSSTSTPDCAYDPRRLATGEDALERLQARMYECYGGAARAIVVGSDTLDRLTILGRLGNTADAVRRRALFMALGPVWRSVNAGNEGSSPYRTMLALSAALWRRDGSPIALAAHSLGIDSTRVEATLVSILETWRDRSSVEPMEPWDWWYAGGAASGKLSPHVSRTKLREINDRAYRELGADPAVLEVRYDLEARPGKTPVAYCDFGTPPRVVGRQWSRAQPWVFATYRDGGFDNLYELLHETGHAVHIAGIRTRPAFADWPDSDPFSEALGELVALEIYEPAWQLRYLGDSASTRASLRAKYSGVVLDVAWALLELRLHADPSRDPNAEWTRITSEYLRITPHPELSWWAMRGQLVDSPGYMMNYALGAIIAAELRARARTLRGPMGGDRGTYEWLSDRIYRFGLERPSREVIESFLGRRLSAQTLIEDMRRIGPS